MIFLSILIIFISLLIPNFSQISFAENFYYAKITDENICFYSTPTKNNLSCLFYLPKSYFVKLLDDENEEFYYAKYKDVCGYVLKNEVTVMSGTPLNPFPTATFRVFSPEGQGLYTSPYLNENNRITTIPYLTKNINFYGTILGEQVIPDKSAQWFYCNYNSNDNYYGFVYSVFCDQLETIPLNTETFEIIENPQFKEFSSSQELSSTSMVFIIAGVSLPCLIVIYLLIKPTLIKDKVMKPIQRKHKGDYYEFDESDLD